MKITSVATSWAITPSTRVRNYTFGVPLFCLTLHHESTRVLSGARRTARSCSRRSVYAKAWSREMRDTWELWELGFLVTGLAMSWQRTCWRTRRWCEKAAGGNLWAEMDHWSDMLWWGSGIACRKLLFMQLLIPTAWRTIGQPQEGEQYHFFVPGMQRELLQPLLHLHMLSRPVVVHKCYPNRK